MILRAWLPRIQATMARPPFVAGVSSFCGRTVEAAQRNLRWPRISAAVDAGVLSGTRSIPIESRGCARPHFDRAAAFATTASPAAPIPFRGRVWWVSSAVRGRSSLKQFYGANQGRSIGSTTPDSQKGGNWRRAIFLWSEPLF